MQEILRKADCVEFKIHSLTGSIQPTKSKEIENSLQSLSQEHIWQKSTYTLSLSQSGHIDGELYYGDNLDDEWYLVYLLFSLTRLDESLAVQIYDSDGEFLLIQASKWIPDWLEPENSVNRVFIHRGKFYIIPREPENPSQIDQVSDGPLELVKSLILLRNETISPCSVQIQSCLDKRMKTKPFHHVTCQVPTLIGQLLQDGPRLIARAVNAFYYRTPDALKQCIKMTKFSPSELVKKRVKFTRCLYAQLLNQDISFPRVFPRLPPRFDSTYLGLSLGYKIACGFEMDYHSNPDVYRNLLSNPKPFENEKIEPDDSDQWLKAYQEVSNKNNMDPKDIFNKMKAFMKKESNFDGIDENDLDAMEEMEEDMEFGEMKKYLDEMDQELQQEGFDDLEEDQIEMMKNLFESLKNEGGMGGPISTLFGDSNVIDEEDED